MLADNFVDSACLGSLDKDVHKPLTFLSELVCFIKDQLPKWRDDHDRDHETSETELTSQLCAYLNSASHDSNVWDCLQFRTEKTDEKNKGRKIDLIPSPLSNAIMIEKRRYSIYHILIPIECKRLPTPKETERDPREYVVSQYNTTGGIYRFKEGLHGAAHTFGAMIAYIQDDIGSNWHSQVNKWIDDLVTSAQSGWTQYDRLVLDHQSSNSDVTDLSSIHTRTNSLPDISLRHLWVNMSSPKASSGAKIV